MNQIIYFVATPFYSKVGHLDGPAVCSQDPLNSRQQYFKSLKLWINTWSPTIDDSRPHNTIHWRYFAFVMSYCLIRGGCREDYFFSDNSVTAIILINQLACLRIDSLSKHVGTSLSLSRYRWRDIMGAVWNTAPYSIWQYSDSVWLYRTNCTLLTRSFSWRRRTIPLQRNH